VSAAAAAQAIKEASQDFLHLDLPLSPPEFSDPLLSLIGVFFRVKLCFVIAIVRSFLVIFVLFILFKNSLLLLIVLAFVNKFIPIMELASLSISSVLFSDSFAKVSFNLCFSESGRFSNLD